MPRSARRPCRFRAESLGRRAAPNRAFVFTIVGAALILAGCGKESSSPPPQDPRGACCLESGCEVRTALDCFADGVYLGDGVTCEPPACQAEGACCALQICTVTTASSCLAPREYQGDGSDCVPNPCPVYGACCLGEGCAARTEGDCGTLGGDYWGDGSTCTPLAEGGPNRGGVLLAHHAVGVGPEDIGRLCRPGIERCEEIVTVAPVDSVVLVVVFAAFPASTAPNVGSVAFGIHHGLEILQWETCGESITFGGWPQSGGGIVVSWQPGRAERFFPVCWFLARGTGGAFDFGDHPRFGPPHFVADELPAREDPVRALGRVGFGETPGRRLCPCP